MYLKIPRNHAFLDRLPRIFEMTVKHKKNELSPTKIWYFVEIKQHPLHILSSIILKEGKTYTIEKVSPLEMRIIDS